MTQGIYINVSRRNDDLPEMIEEYSEKFNLSKADTVAEILRAYPKLIAYKQKVMELTGLSKSTIYRLEAIGRFPKRIKLGSNCIAYFNLIKTPPEIISIN